MIKLAATLLIGSFALSVFLTAIVKNFAAHIGFAAHPVADRYNRRTVPLGGGIAIFTTLLIFILAATAVIKFATCRLDSLAQTANINPSDFLGKFKQLLAILLSVTALFALGLWDDKKKLGPFFKLAVQFAVAVVAAYFADVRLEFFIHNKNIGLP